MHRVSIFILLFLTSSAAWSCSCSSPELAIRVANSDVIVVGKIVKIEEFESGNAHQTLKGKIRSEELLKGTIAKEFTLLTGYGVGDCGLGFKVGEEYLFFLNGESAVTGCQGHIFNEKTGTDTIFIPEGYDFGLNSSPTYEEQLKEVKRLLKDGI